MSRRDTIIISVLVNAALLAVLFITAVTTKNSAKEDVKLSSSSVLEETTIDAKELFSSNVENSMENKDLVALTGSNTTPTTIAANEMIPSEIKKEFATSLIENENIIKKEDEKVLYKLPEVAKSLEELKSEVSTNDVANSINVIVKKGDTLEKIAKANKTKVSDIIQANNLSNSFLKIGQQLVIPKKINEKNVSTETVKTDLIAKNQPEYYTLKVGDNPYTVAVKHNLKLADILKINKLDEKKARKLKPGDKLRIR
jgi:peptidoglycan DL-endopeptidase LytF